MPRVLVADCQGPGGCREALARTRERIQAQTLNDFLVFGAQAMASLLAGLAVTTVGWERLNLATLPLLAAVLLAMAALRRRPALAPGQA